MTRATAFPAARRPEPFTALTAIALALLGLALAWGLADSRMIGGVPVWVKPAKFALSFAIHFGTLAVIVSALGDGARSSRPVRIAATVMGVAFFGEMAYLVFQAAQAEASHFNLSTPFHRAMYQLMGIGAVLLIGMPLLVARAAGRDRAARLGPATREGIRWGAILSFVLTLGVAGYMSSGTGHLVGTPSPGAPTIPPFGWSAEVGDLRPAHFLALHALQALPLAGLWADRRGDGPGTVRMVAAIWAVLTLAVFAQALMGLPLVRL